MNAPTPAPQTTLAETIKANPAPTTTEVEIEPIKAIVMAPSGTGKTCLLASLLSEGYNVRVMDFDDGIKSLRNLLIDDAKQPSPAYAKDSLSRLRWATLTEPMKVAGGRIFPIKASVWPRAVNLLEKWLVEDPRQGGTVDLGKVSDWGPRDVLVFDTLSKLAQAAHNQHLALNGQLGQAQSGNSHMRNIGAAQGLVSSLLDMIFDTSIKCNVILNTHITYSKEDGTMPAQGEEGALLFGYPKAIGRSIGPNIPTYFRDVLTLRKQGNTAKLVTKDDFVLGLKSCAPLRVAKEYKRETGLAEYFKAVRGA